MLCFPIFPRVQRLSWCHFSVCLMSVLAHLKPCDWLTRFMKVIFLASHWSESLCSPNLYWGQANARIHGTSVHSGDILFGHVWTKFILLFSLALAETCINRKQSVHLLFRLALSRTMGHVFFEGQTCGEVLSALPYIRGFIFRFAVSFKWQVEGRPVEA